MLYLFIRNINTASPTEHLITLNIHFTKVFKVFNFVLPSQPKFIKKFKIFLSNVSLSVSILKIDYSAIAMKTAS